MCYQYSAILSSHAEKVTSSIGFLIKIKTELQVLTLRTSDQRTGNENRLAFLDSFLGYTKVVDKITFR